MRRSVSRSVVFALVAAASGWLVALSTATMSLADDRRQSRDESVHANARAMIQEGRRTFRSDTFGDEAFWGDALRLHEAIAGAKLDGVGPGVSPRTRWPWASRLISIGCRLTSCGRCAKATSTSMIPPRRLRCSG